MYNPDRPIEFLNEDSLNRKEFAKNIGNGILKSKTTESFVIGLIGDWGSGKTSLVNMVIDHINDPTLYQPEKKPIIVKFNPWNFSEQNQLIYQFFNQLSSDLQIPNYSKALTNAGRSLKTLGKIFSVGTILPIPVVNQTASIGRKILDSGGEAAESVGKLFENDLTVIKKGISENLKNQDKKIIIVIDDIDRLNDREIRQVFQLVKSLADFPKTVYLLTFARKVLVNALNKDQLDYGEDYLEKIIQIPIEIPLITKQELEEILCGHLKKLIESNLLNKNDCIRWNNIYNSGFKYFFKSIRDVTRYINVLKFYFEIVKGKVNSIDFFAITAIQVFNPDVYQGIRENKPVFAGSFTQLHDIYRVQYQQTFDSIIESSNKNTKGFLREYLMILFPKLVHLYGNSYDSFGFGSSWRKDRLICSEEFFDFYFSFSLPKGEISQEEIESILTSTNNPDTLSAKLEELSNKKILGFLSMIPDYVDKVQKEDVETIVKVLMDLGDLFSKDESSSHETHEAIHDCVNLLLANLESEEKKFDVLKNSFRNATRSLCTIVNEVHHLRIAHEKYYGKEAYTHIKRIILDLDQLKMLEDIVKEKIKNKADSGDLDKHREVIYILKRWRLLEADEKLISSVISRIVESDDKLINFISNCMSQPHSNCIFDNTVDCINISFITEFVDIEKVESRMRKINLSGDLESMSEREKRVVKLFLANIKDAKEKQ